MHFLFCCIARENLDVICICNEFLWFGGVMSNVYASNSVGASTLPCGTFVLILCCYIVFASPNIA